MEGNRTVTATRDTAQGSETLALVNGHVVPIVGADFDGGILIHRGKIVDLGPSIEVPSGAQVIDAQRGWILPGFIDAHSHVGLREEGEGWSGDDGGESSSAVLAGLRAIDGINPADQGFADALSAGITTVGVNPTSRVPIGGLCLAMKTAGRTVDEMVINPAAGLKSALGENPKRTFSDRGAFPSSRLGVAFAIRSAFADASARVVAESGQGASAMNDLAMSNLVAVIRREMPLRQHCHRADDIATAIRLADEFGYRLVIEHGTEAYLLADVLAERQIPVLVGPWFIARSKPELRNLSAANAAALVDAGVEVSIITDHPMVPEFLLVHQAAWAVTEGLGREAALRAITINPARVLGIEQRVGSIAPGMDADVVVWSGDPLITSNRPSCVLVDGIVRSRPRPSTSSGAASA